MGRFPGKPSGKHRTLSPLPKPGWGEERVKARPGHLPGAQAPRVIGAAPAGPGLVRPGGGLFPAPLREGGTRSPHEDTEV
uniref:Uncharacterized protein LOC110207703 n=1 Tax=Phascolarctos cinereus TaxID=38626 RepID=A0A6P5K6R1_PHACI|nr:uncharacterized protein LOC110207703 [Phascolarctos cinereus]